MASAIAPLLLALVAADPGPPIDTAARAEAVALQAVLTAPPAAWLLDGDWDPRVGRLVKCLGCEHAGCRDTAEEALAAVGPKAYRALARAARHRDREVRERAVRLLRRLIDCPGCRGTGIGDNTYATYDEFGVPSGFAFYLCGHCGGAGLKDWWRQAP